MTWLLYLYLAPCLVYVYSRCIGHKYAPQERLETEHSLLKVKMKHLQKYEPEGSADRFYKFVYLRMRTLMNIALGWNFQLDEYVRNSL